MGQSTFPVPSSGSSTSTIVPVNASSVILDGSLTSAGTYTTTVNGNGGIAYLTATDNPATITVGGTAYSVPANTVVASKAFGSSTSVTILANLNAPTTPQYTTMPSNNYWSGLAYGNSLWVAVGGFNGAYGNANNTFGAYSSNGTSWTAMTMSSSKSWTQVVYGTLSGTGYFIASSWNSTVFAYSTNGTTWTNTTVPSATYQNGSLAYGNGIFLAVKGETSSSTGIYSTNATSWSSVTLPSTQYWGGVSYGNGLWVATAGTNSSSSNLTAYSTNGTTWTAGAALPSSANWYNVTNNNLGYWMISGGTRYNSNAYAYTTSQSSGNPVSSWTAGTFPSSAYWYGVVYGGGWYTAASASSGSFVYSPNGVTWTAVTVTGIYGVSAFANNEFIALNGNNTNSATYFTPSYMLPVNFGIYAGPTTIN